MTNRRASKAEFLIGKQLPYVALAILNAIIMIVVTVLGFGVPLSGNVLALLAASVAFAGASTGIGLLMSTFMESQMAAIFATALITLIPSTQFSGLLNPVSSLTGGGWLIGVIFPSTYFLTISRGVFSKALGFSDLWMDFIPVFLATPILLGCAIIALRKQEK